MHRYRTHNCGQLRASDEGSKVRLSGWINKKRNLGGLLFVALRDSFGITQIIVDPQNSSYNELENLRVESVITVDGIVKSRGKDINKSMPTGEIEIEATNIIIQSHADILPFQIAEDDNAPETTRLTNRFLDLRRERLHKNILLRSDIIFSMRRRMYDLGYKEFQTPILTSSSPEGARDYLVPSRLYPGKFYALPQAPQQFKQLLMVSGFDKYFQIAPCFRDEDARADRSPGEFYQIDIELSFATQEDVFSDVEKLMHGLFTEFSEKKVTDKPFPRITYKEAINTYGTDKPDLRYGLPINDLTDIFANSDFSAFKSAISSGSVVKAIAVPGISEKSRKYLKNLEEFAKELGAKGLASLIYTDSESCKGSLAKPLNDSIKQSIRDKMQANDGCGVFMVADQNGLACSILGKLRTHLAEDLNLIETDAFKFCWIVDFPMFEKDEETGKVQFSHNPFSMPQGGLEALINEDPLNIKAWQYDLVCNGVELSSGAIRNHLPEIMYKAFEIAGYDIATVDKEFKGMIRAFQFGAPPHGGIAPGVDRIVMLLAGEKNIREVIAFPMNQNAQDLLMNAPCEVTEEQLEELSLKITPKKTEP